MPFEPAPLSATNIVAGFTPGLPPPIDVVELLPPSSRPLLLAIRQRAEDAMNLVRPLHDRLDELRTERHLLSARLADLRRPRGQGGPGLGDDDTQVIDAKRKLDRVDAEMARLNELIEVRRARSRDISTSVAQIEDWLRIGRPSGTAIIEAREIDAATSVKRGETATTALDRVRRRLRELAADQHRVESAPFPSSYAKARARAAIEQLAERGVPNVSPLVEAGHDIDWPMTMTRLELAAIVGKSGDQIAGRAMGEVVDTMALFAWLHRDALVAKLEAEIGTVADDTAALSPEDREQRLAEIAADRLATERAEAALVRRMQEDGMPVEHRLEADPVAVLCIELVVSSTVSNSEPYGEAAKALAWAGRFIQAEPPGDAT